MVAQHDRNYQITLIVYILQAIGLFLGITFFIGLVINYVKRPSLNNTIYASHCSWQIATIWWGLFWWVLGFITHFILIGYVIWGISYLWLIYRIVKGWIYLYEQRPMSNDSNSSGPRIIDHQP